MARQRAESAMKTPETPKLFDNDLLEDMQQCLVKLERRVRDGPGALSILEVEEFDFATKRILEEMKRNEHNRPKPAAAFPEKVAMEEQVAPTRAAPQSNREEVAASIAGVSDADHNPEEGDAFNGNNGFGLAQGTTNTYVIPGMDEMSPEEYQKALQKSVSDRQALRVKGGNYGNKATWDYLNNLGSSSTHKKRWDPKGLE